MKEDNLKTGISDITTILEKNFSHTKQKPEEISHRPERQSHIRPVMNQEPPEESMRDP